MGLKRDSGTPTPMACMRRSSRRIAAYRRTTAWRSTPGWCCCSPIISAMPRCCRRPLQPRVRRWRSGDKYFSSPGTHRVLAPLHTTLPPRNAVDMPAMHCWTPRLLLKSANAGVDARRPGQHRPKRASAAFRMARIDRAADRIGRDRPDLPAGDLCGACELTGKRLNATKPAPLSATFTQQSKASPASGTQRSSATRCPHGQHAAARTAFPRAFVRH